MAAGGNNIVFPAVSTTGGGYFLTLHWTEGGPMLSLDFVQKTYEGSAIPINLIDGPAGTFIANNQQYMMLLDDGDTSEQDSVQDTSSKDNIDWTIELPRIRIEEIAATNYIQIVELYYRIKKWLSTAIDADIIVTSLLDDDDGTEKITNGTFTGAATGWSLGTGWSYSANTVVHSGSTGAGDLTQTGRDVQTGCVYKAVYTVSGATGVGTMTPSLGGKNGTTITAIDGTYTDYITCGDDNTSLVFSAGVNWSGTLDDVSLTRGGESETEADIQATGTRYLNVFGNGFDVLINDLSAGTLRIEEILVTVFVPSEE